MKTARLAVWLLALATLAVGAFSTPTPVEAISVSWDRPAVGRINPINILDTVFGNVFTGTSTTATSSFPILSAGLRFLGAGLVDCDSATSALTWDISTWTFGCHTISSGGGYGQSWEINGNGQLAPTTTIPVYIPDYLQFNSAGDAYVKYNNPDLVINSPDNIDITNGSGYSLFVSGAGVYTPNNQAYQSQDNAAAIKPILLLNASNEVHVGNTSFPTFVEGTAVNVPALTSGTVYANGTHDLSTQTGTAGNCVEWGASGAIVDAASGAPCGSGGGSSFGQSWEIDGNGNLAPTTTIPVYIPDYLKFRNDGTAYIKYNNPGLIVDSPDYTQIIGTASTLTVSTDGVYVGNGTSFGSLDSGGTFRAIAHLNNVDDITIGDAAERTTLYGTALVLHSALGIGTGVLYRAFDGVVANETGTDGNCAQWGSDNTLTDAGIPCLTASSVVASIKQTYGSAQTGAITLASSTSGSDFSITNSGGVFTFALPSASASVRGLLTSTDWSTFNNKQAALTFTYPLVNTTNTISLAFGTTTANTWSSIQTFTVSPVFSTLGAGTVNSTAGGKLYNTSTSTPTLASEFTYGGTLGQFISGVSGQLSLTTNGTALIKLVQVNANTVLGNNTGATGNVVAFATSSLGIAISDTTGTLAVARGGTGDTTFTSGQLIYGNGTNALSSVATGTLSFSAPLAADGTVVIVGTSRTITCSSCITSALTSIGPAGALQTGPAITLGTSSTAYHGLTASTTITATTNLITFTNTLIGTLDVGAGGTGLTSVGDGRLVYGSTATALTSLASSTGGFLTNSYTTGRPIWSATSTLNIAATDLTGTLGVAHGGTGVGTFTSSQLLYGNGTSALTSVSTSSLAFSSAFSGASALGALVGGSNSTVDLATNGVVYAKIQQVGANKLLGNPTGATANVSEIATSTLYGTCTGGQVVGWSNTTGGLTCIATSTVAAGITSIGPTGQTSAGPTITLATTTSTTNGLTSATTIVGSGSTMTFTPSLTGTLTVAGGGTGVGTFTSGQLLYGNGTNALSSVATSSGQCTSASGITCSAFTVVGAVSPTFALASIPNSSLTNSSISGVALGGTLNSLSHGSTLTGTSYNGSATVSNWDIDLTHANTWTALQTFTNATSTLFSTTYGSTTNAFIGTLNLPGITGTQCLHSISGVVSGTGSDCGSGGGTTVGTISTSTSETSGNIPVYSSTAAYPATLSNFTGFTYSGASAQLGIPSNGWIAKNGKNILYSSSTALTLVIGEDAGGQVATTTASATFGMTAVGIGALKSVNTTTATRNTALGYTALSSLTTGGSNTAVGYAAYTASLTTGSANTAVGAFAGSQQTGSDNTWIGATAGSNSGSGSDNIAIGSLAAQQASLGSRNTIIGKSAGSFNGTNGSGNILIGAYVDHTVNTNSAMLNIGDVLYGSGMYNTASSNSKPTSNGRISVGSTTPAARFSIHAMGGDTNINLFMIGSSTASATTTLVRVVNTGQLFLSSGLTTASAGNGLCLNTTTFEVDNAGTQSCTVSSIRFKTNVADLTPHLALDEIEKMRAVSFDYKKGYYAGNEGPESVGLIAEEVQKIDPRLVDLTDDGQVGTLHWDRFTGLFVQAIQDQQAQIDQLKSGSFKLARSVEENYQWGAIVLLGLWNIWLTRRKRK